MGCSVGWTATVAAFMATKPTGGTGWQAERSEALDGKGRLFCFAMESGLWPRRKIVGRQPLPGWPACGPIALWKAEARSSPAVGASG
jgi:hypothetical protein